MMTEGVNLHLERFSQFNSVVRTFVWRNLQKCLKRGEKDVFA